MNIKAAAPGYIMIMALMFLSLMIYTTTYILTKKLVYQATAHNFLDEKKANMLALGGINIALAQLSKKPESDNAQKSSAKTDTKEAGQATKVAITFLKTFLPIQGRWQHFSLKEQVDGLDGECQICLTSEDGKLDINALYDFKNHVFFNDKDGKPSKNNLIEVVFERIAKDTGNKNLYADLEKFLKNRSHKIGDVTELLTIKEFEKFYNAVWYEPETLPTTTHDNQLKKHPIYLADIFTVWTHKKNIEPWLISDSLCALLDLTTLHSRVITQERIAELLKNFKLQSAWATDWNKQLGSLYGKNFTMLPSELEKHLETQFEPSIFSVLSYAKVGRITKKLLAIVERNVRITEEKVEIKNSIKKLYWL